MSIHTEQYEKLITTQPFKDMSIRITERLGFLEMLNDSVIVTMYRACAFEQAWWGEQISLGQFQGGFCRDPDTLSKWCTVFDKEDLKLLEYAEDIHIFYKSGYGSDFNPRLGCPILRDLYSRTENVINGAFFPFRCDTRSVRLKFLAGVRKGPTVVAQFTHSTAFHQFITALNLYKDEVAPTGENYEIQGDRRWKTAMFGPSSTNLVGILYKCYNTSEKYQMQFLLDENPFDVVDGCERGLCPWRKFKEKYEKTAQSCDTTFCSAFPQTGSWNKARMFKDQCLCIKLIIHTGLIKTI